MNIYELELEINRVIMDGMTEDGELTSDAEAALENKLLCGTRTYRHMYLR